MSSRCDHAGLVEKLVTLHPHPTTGPFERTVWQCTGCHATWPRDPRQLAAQHDGLLEALLDGIPDAPPTTEDRP